MLSVTALASGLMMCLLPLLVKENRRLEHEGTSVGDENSIDGGGVC